MPKLLHISGARIIKALERLGFVSLRRTGSHVIMQRGSKG
ncbi:MAG: type II toxin-antitoxin system HicA family toxin [Burkholderiales bacterium]